MSAASVDMTHAITLMAAHLDGDTDTIDAILDGVDPAQLARELYFLALMLGRQATGGDDHALRRSLGEALTQTVEH